MTGSALVYGLWRGETFAVLGAEWALTAKEELEAWEHVCTVGTALALAARTNTALPPPIDPEDCRDLDSDDPFALSECGAVNDGDWPGMPGAWTLEFFPEAAALGRMVETIFNGPYLYIAPEAESRLVALARERGYEIVRDDDLINRLARWS